jgi:hypothetical protein
LSLRVQPEEPRQAALLTGLVILSAGAGLNALLLLYALLIWAFFGTSWPWWRFIAINVGGLIPLALFIVLWLKLWNRIRRLDRRGRWLLVVACGLATATDLVVFTRFIQ